MNTTKEKDPVKTHARIETTKQLLLTAPILLPDTKKTLRDLILYIHLKPKSTDTVTQLGSNNSRNNKAYVDMGVGSVDR